MDTPRVRVEVYHMSVGIQYGYAPILEYPCIIGSPISQLLYWLNIGGNLHNTQLEFENSCE